MKRTLLIITTLVLTYCTNAQYPFDANHVNLIMWLSPDTGAYNALGNPAQPGDDIYEWHDITGNGYIFENNYNNNRPSLVNDGGLRYLDFTPGDFLQNEAVKNELNGLDEFSIFIVVKSDLIGTDKGFLDSENPDGNDDNICLRYDNVGANTGRNNCLKTGMVGNNANQQVESQANTQTTDRQVLTLAWERGEKLYLYIDGEVSDSSNNPFSNVISNVQKILIGKGPKDGSLTGNGGWDGKIGEVIFFNRKLPSDSIHDISGALPIKLTRFEGKPSGLENMLIWETASECNNNYFTIEKSKDAKEFIVLGTVAGAGYSNSSITYTYTDNNPYKNISYYRLRQTDYDGKSTLSSTIKIYNVLNSESEYKIWPNPAYGNYLNISSGTDSPIQSVTIVNANGREVFQKRLKTNSTKARLTLQELPSGIYYILIKSENGIQTKKLQII